MATLAELYYNDGQVTETITEPDPDGADRGGFHQVTETVKVKDGAVTHDFDLSDYYEERCGEAEPYANTQENAVHWLKGLAAEHLRASQVLSDLAAKVEAATQFTSNFVPSQGSDESDEEDDEDEVA